MLLIVDEGAVLLEVNEEVPELVVVVDVVALVVSVEIVVLAIDEKMLLLIVDGLVLVIAGEEAEDVEDVPFEIELGVEVEELIGVVLESNEVLLEEEDGVDELLEIELEVAIEVKMLLERLDNAEVALEVLVAKVVAGEDVEVELLFDEIKIDKAVELEGNIDGEEVKRELGGVGIIVVLVGTDMLIVT